MGLASDVDVAVIGAGAAGIASARTLASSGLSVVVLEARDRIGGRALTKSLAGGIVFDVGCEWLHSGLPEFPVADRSVFAIRHRRGAAALDRAKL